VNKEIWQDRRHECFECEKPLVFPGKPPKWVFSHAHSKGSRPDLRHVKENIALHCKACHRVWEFGAREFMPKTMALFQRLGEKFPDNKHGRHTVEKDTVD